MLKSHVKHETHDPFFRNKGAGADNAVVPFKIFDPKYTLNYWLLIALLSQ